MSNFYYLLVRLRDPFIYMYQHCLKSQVWLTPLVWLETEIVGFSQNPRVQKRFYFHVIWLSFFLRSDSKVRIIDVYLRYNSNSIKRQDEKTTYIEGKCLLYYCYFVLIFNTLNFTKFFVKFFLQTLSRRKRKTYLRKV